MEAATTAPSTSKVTIQCTDPDHLLAAFEARLSTQTPLRNLHWKSPTRPLRSIPSLNISLVRKEIAQNGAQSGARRHQIPGLRETPYLKLYLLRCDDKDSYKESARKEIKHWIKENTLEKESKTALRNQEHHDAYEWMIIHVVIPGTAAASQPKSSKHISLGTTDSTDSVNSKSKWTGKSTSTIFDKLRADFNSPKSPIPRVAQVRITEQEKPSGSLPAAEVEEQWQELVDNLKAAILNSFDTRVSEYEDDIRERESQRSLPGWNFCTFFILKEGLARGFENVGLLDDALTVYRELETGLDMAVKETHGQDDVESAGALSPYSKDLKMVIRRALDDAPNSSWSQANGDAKALSLENIFDLAQDQSPLKLADDKYRDLILKNQVSALDLRTYMFTRQMGIMLRQAGLSEDSKSVARPAQTDLNVLADFAELAMSFINQAAREYRADFYAAWGGQLSGAERATQKIVIGNVVASWTWSAVMHVAARLLSALPKGMILLDKPAESILSGLIKQPSQEEHDKRPWSQDRHSGSSASSSPYRGPRPQSLPRPATVSKESLDVQVSQTGPPARPGFDRLCGWIAQMFLQARGVLYQLESSQSWSSALQTFDLEVQGQRRKKTQRLASYGAPASLNGNTLGTHSNEPKDNRMLCLESLALRTASSSQDAFSNLYRSLSTSACHLFNCAGYRRAMDRVLIDLAELAYSSGNKPAAADLLGKALDSTLQSGNASLQPSTVAMYAECLENVDRPNQYAECLLACLRFSSAHHFVARSQEYFDKLARVAELIDPVEVSLVLLLMIRNADKTISHFDNRDGFLISLQVQPMLPVMLSSSEPMKLYLSAIGPHEPEQLLLQGPTNVELGSGSTSFAFASNVNTQGWYELDRLEIKIGKMSFVHRFQQDPRESIGQQPRKNNAPTVMVYPAYKAVSLEIIPSTSIVLGETRSLSLIAQAGRSDISLFRIRLRAASAGLRLKLHDSTSTRSLTIACEQETLILELDQIFAETTVMIEIPYTLESTSEPSIVVKCEADYASDGQAFNLYKTCFIDVILPVSVNVQDIHRDSYCYSKFLIRPATLVPVVLLGCSLDDDGETGGETGEGSTEPSMVFPNQPATWTVRLRQFEPKANRRLVLNVRYQCLDELILNRLSDHFTTAFKQSPYPQAITLLRSHLIQTIKHGWTEQDLEVAGLTREMEVWPMQDLNWRSVLCAFDESSKDVIRVWIENWHSKAPPMPLRLDEAPVRLLKLPVDLPPRPPRVDTGLAIGSASVTVPIGQPLVSELRFQVSMHQDKVWTGDLEFSYEMFAPPETWLIGGRKKGSFSATSGTTALEIVLFPQRSGTLLLPSIDVRCRRNQGSNTGKTWLDVPIDVNNRTLSKSIQVTTSLRSTTIGLTTNEATQMSSGMMIDSQSREAAAL